MLSSSGIENVGKPANGFQLKPSPMFRSYWTIAWRTLVRNKIYTLVNVAGLTLGICACLVIWVIVHYEFSFDRDHPDGNRIYRINSYEQFLKNEPERVTTAVVLAGLPEAVQKGVPGIETVASFHILMNDTASISGGRNQKNDYPVQSVTAGPEYFRIMPYDWLAGDQQTALVYPFSVVLTESRARLYFGDVPNETVIGREVVYQDSLRVHVSGVVRDWSARTDFPFTDFISQATVEHSFLFRSLRIDPSMANKYPAVASVLVKLVPNADPDKTKASLSLFYDKNFQGHFLFTRIELQPLNQVHFTVTGGEDVAAIRTSQLSTLYALLSIALFILALAIINYINLATAQSLSREKEISIRKVMGSGRISLIVQLLTETFMLTALAGTVAVAAGETCAWDFQPIRSGDDTIRSIGACQLAVPIGYHGRDYLVGGIIPGPDAVGTFAGAQTLNGAGAPRGDEKWWLRKGLIVFPVHRLPAYSSSGRWSSAGRSGYMLHKDLGFRSDAIMLFDTGERRDSVRTKPGYLQQAIAQLPGVLDVARENIPPAGPDRTMTGIRYPVSSKDRMSVEAIIADEHYIPLYGMRLLAGRDLFPSDTMKEVVINESLSRLLGFRKPEEAVGAQLFTWNKNIPVVGVVADFHKYSYHDPIQPLLIAGMACTDIAVRLDAKGKSAAEELRSIMDRVEREWKKVYPHRPFEFNFIR